MSGNEQASRSASAAGLDAAERYFDPRLAAAPIRIVPLALVIDPLVVPHAPERVCQYRVAMERGERFPPIAVVRAVGRYWVADGHKRLTAFQQASDARHIVVQIWGWRRWFGDQAAQLRRSLRRLGHAAQSLAGSGDRVEARAELVNVLAHWRRMARSLGVHVRRALAGLGADSRHGVLLRLLRECWREPWPMIVAIVSLVSAAAAQLGLTWMVKLWIEGPVLARNAERLPVVVSATAACALVFVLSLFTSKMALAQASQSLLARLRAQVQAHYLALEMTAARARPSGDRVSRLLADAGQLAVFMRDGLHRLVGESLVVAGAVAAMFYLEWRLALAVVVFGPPVALLLARVGRRIRRRAGAANVALGTLSATVTEQLHGLATIKVFQAEAFERDRFARANADHREAALRADAWSALLVTGVWLLTGIVLLAAMAVGTAGVIGGSLTPATLGVFCLYAAQTVEPLRRLSELHALLQRMLAAAERVYEAIDEAPTEARGGAALAGSPQGALRFASVHFAYRPEQPVLDGLDLEVAAGEAVAIVGASGVGKSTLAQLLVGFARPQHGSIRLDGQDLTGLDLCALRRVVCVVEQEPMVFGGSLRDNLRYGSWDAPRAAVEAAVDLVGLRELIDALPGGLDAELAESGRDLSGGQRQRIALARAIVRDPTVLVLDEATSALDGEAEARLFERLAEWMAGRTVLTVAHRLSTVSRFARVVVLDAGRVVGDGTVSDLAGECLVFRRLFAEQLDAARGTPRPVAEGARHSTGGGGVAAGRATNQ